ncbi:hypothetical protein DL769_011460 [Monosporascus sp. CRB-8-3]|nr:hypothetical protein DL769_011460 [Monosporascus sp. CRB-8-3]
MSMDLLAAATQRNLALDQEVAQLRQRQGQRPAGLVRHGATAAWAFSAEQQVRRSSPSRRANAALVTAWFCDRKWRPPPSSKNIMQIKELARRG